MSEVEAELAAGLEALHPAHRRRFERMRVPIRPVPVDDMPGESVLVVAEHQGKLLYWSDIEDGWELDPATSSGGIASRGCNQFELTHLMHQEFGDPEHQ